jgi:hypothetical protein
MEKRTESEILAKAPIKVTLGVKEYKIPVLTVLPARDWRTKLDASMAGLADSFKVVESASANAVANGLTFALIQFPEKVADLVFDYAGESLPKDEILQNATEEQLGTAFSAIMQVAYPFLPQLAMVTQVMRANLPQSARFTN